MKKEITLGQLLTIGIVIFGAVAGFWINSIVSDAVHEKDIVYLKENHKEFKDEMKGLRSDIKDYNKAIIEAINKK